MDPLIGAIIKFWTVQLRVFPMLSFIAMILKKCWYFALTYSKWIMESFMNSLIVVFTAKFYNMILLQ